MKKEQPSKRPFTGTRSRTHQRSKHWRAFWNFRKRHRSIQAGRQKIGVKLRPYVSAVALGSCRFLHSRRATNAAHRSHRCRKPVSGSIRCAWCALPVGVIDAMKIAFLRRESAPVSRLEVQASVVEAVVVAKAVVPTSRASARGTHRRSQHRLARRTRSTRET